MSIILKTEEYAIINVDGKVVTTRWDHVHGNCNRPSRVVMKPQLNTPVNGRSVVDIKNDEWITSASNVPSHHNSAPVQAT